MTSFYFILFYYNKDSPTEHSSDRGGLHMAGGCHKVKCANEKKRKKKKKDESGIIIRTMPFSFSFLSLFLIILIKEQPFFN